MLTVCQLCLLLLVVTILAQDHRLRTLDSDEHRIRRKPKWSHFFVMHEPRSEEKDKAQGFFYQVGMGPPVINRLRSSPPGFQSQAGAGNMAQYNPALHSPYPNRQQTNEQMGLRMRDSFGARMPNLQSPPVFNEPQNPTGIAAETGQNGQNFQSEIQGVPNLEENFPENRNAPLQFEPEISGGAAAKSGTEILGAQGPVSSHTTVLLQRNRQQAAVPHDSSEDSQFSVNRKPSFVIGGQSVFGKRDPLPSHLTPILPPAIDHPGEKESTADNNNHEHEKERLSVAQHIPVRTGSTLPVLDQIHSERDGLGLIFSGPNNRGQTLPDRNKKSENEQREGKIINRGTLEDHSDQNGYRKEVKLVNSLPEKKQSIDQERNLREKAQTAEIQQQSEINGWQSQPELNPQRQDGTPEIFFEGTRNGREREPVSHDFKKTSYQTQHEKASNSPLSVGQKYNFLPIPQQDSQANNAYNPPSLVNFNTNIHLHAGSPASPNIGFQQEKSNQPSHSLSVHPYAFQIPESEFSQPALQKDSQNSNADSKRITSSQHYFLRPSNIPLIIREHQNGPYRQDNRDHFPGQTNLRASQTPSHLTAILPLRLGNPKENVEQRVPQNIFVSNANERTPNVEYSEVLLQNEPQDEVVPSVNPAINTATHSIRLLLPQQQLPQFSERPTAIPPSVSHIPGTSNGFQTHQVNLLPNSRGYVQTQVQLPPLNFRFQLTPVKDDSNESFIGDTDTQKITQPNFQPIPYQYQLPLQPVSIQGTHQILFPNLQIANIPLETPTVVPSDEGQGGSTTKSSERHSVSPGNIEPVTEPSAVEDSVDKATISDDQTVNKDGTQKNREDQDFVLVATVPTGETTVDERERMPENNLSVKEDTGNDTKEDTVVKFFTPGERKTDENLTTESKNADNQLSSNVTYSDEKDEVHVPTTDGMSLELTTQSQFSTGKPSLNILSVLTFTEAPKTADDVRNILEDVKTEGTTLVDKKSVTTSGNLENSSLSTDDSADEIGKELSSTLTVQTTVSTTESTALEKSTDDLADKNRNELPTTASKAPSTVSTTESTTLEQSTDDLADKNKNELSTSKSPTNVSTKQSTTLEQSTEDLSDKSSNELPTTATETPTTVSTRESTTLEQSSDLVDSSNGELTTITSEAWTTVSPRDSTPSERDHISTTEKKQHTEGVPGTSDEPRDILDEDPMISDPTNTFISDAPERTSSTETPEDSPLTTTNVPSSTQTSTATVGMINDMSSVITDTKILIKLSETTSDSTVSTVSSSTETISTISVKGTTNAPEEVSETESSATELPADIVKTKVTTSISAEIDADGLTTDQPFQTETKVSAPVSTPAKPETTTTSVSFRELNQTNAEVLLTQISTDSSVTTAVQEIVSLVDTTSPTSADATNEIEQFFTNPATESSSTSSPKTPVTTRSSSGPLNAFNEISVFTFTEPPIIRVKSGETNNEAKGLTPAEKSGDSGTPSGSEISDQTKMSENAESNKSVVDTAVTKDFEVSLNEILVVATTAHAAEDATGEEEKTKLFRGETVKDSNETNIKAETKHTKQSEDSAIFTFVGQTVSETTRETTELSSGSSTSSTSVPTRGSTVDPFTEKVTESIPDLEIPVTTRNNEIESNQNQGRAVGNTDSNTKTPDDSRELTRVLNGREKNENETAVDESGGSTNLNSTEDNPDSEVRSDTEITGLLNDKETKDKPGKEETSPSTIESQNTSTFSSESGDSVTSDSEISTNSKSSDSPILETTTNGIGDEKAADSSDSSSQEMPMIIDNDALELLLNDLVTPRNISMISPVTSTSISILIGIPSESPERILDEDKELSENTSTGQNNDILVTENTSATAVKNEEQEDDTNLREPDNGSSFFSKVFGKSLSPSNDNKQKSLEDSLSDVQTGTDESQAISAVSTEKSQNESSQEENIQGRSSETSSLPGTEAPSSVPETQVTSVSVTPEAEMPISDLSSVKLTVLENFGGKDVPDFTEIAKQHAR